MGHYWGTQVDIPNRRSVGETVCYQAVRGAGATGLEPATSGVTGRRSNQLNYAPDSAGSVPTAGIGRRLAKMSFG